MRITCWELMLLAVLLPAGLAFRLAMPSRMAVEHFDEGVYASNLLCAKYDYQYPHQHLFAPPLFPWLIEWAATLGGGISDFSAMSINLVVGGLTGLLVWLTGRRWFGREAGIAAAALATFSDIHILYSRTALTDTLLCFWLLCALYALWNGIRLGSKKWSVVAGVLISLAWWTKYTGWLPIVIGLAGAVPWRFFTRLQHGRRERAAWLVCWTIAAASAFVLWSPVLISLQSHGGYAAVADNHRQYLVGLTDWPAGFWRQALNHRHLDGLLSCLSPGLALLCVVAAARFCSPKRRVFDESPQQPSGALHRQNPRPTAELPTVAAAQSDRSVDAVRLAAFLVWLIGLSLLVTSSFVTAILAVVGLVHVVGKGASSRRGRTIDTGRQLAGWLLAAWYCGLLVTTPLYTAYPRLTLPWLIASWLAAGAGLSHLSRRLYNTCSETGDLDAATRRTRLRPAWLVLMLGLGLLTTGMAAPRLWENPFPGWQDRTGLRRVAHEVTRDVRRLLAHDRARKTAGFVIYVYGEPALFFQLRDSDVIAGPVTDLKFAEPGAPALPLPTFLLTGPHAERSREFPDQFESVASRLTAMGSYDYQPSDLVLLNDFHPRDLNDANGKRHRYQIRLYRVR